MYSATQKVKKKNRYITKTVGRRLLYLKFGNFPQGSEVKAPTSCKQ